MVAKFVSVSLNVCIFCRCLIVNFVDIVNESFDT